MFEKTSDYYPPSEKLKRQMYPYEAVEALKIDVKCLYSTACRLNLLQDSMCAQIEEQVYLHFKSPQLIARIKELNPYFEKDEVPDLFDLLFRSLPDERIEEFLYILRGLIQEKLSK